MLMSDDCDSMFDIDCLLLKEEKIERSGKYLGILSDDDDDFLIAPPNMTLDGNQRPPKPSADPFDPFLGRRPNALKLSVDRQASLEDLAHVIRGQSSLEAPTLDDGADTIQDLAKYLKDDTQNSPTIPNLIAASNGFPFPSSSHHQTLPPNAPMHNYAIRAPREHRMSGSFTHQQPGIGYNKTITTYPPLPANPSYHSVTVKQERPDTPCSDVSINEVPVCEEAGKEAKTARPDHFQALYTPTTPNLRRKRGLPVAIYKEEPLDDYADEMGGYRDCDDDDQERDSDLPPPRKYVRKNPKSIKDLDEYRKRRERNNEAVRRARAKKRQTEALIHGENRQLRAENNRLMSELEATRLQVQTQDRMIAQLRGQTAPSSNSSTTLTSSSHRIKKPNRRLL